MKLSAGYGEYKQAHERIIMHIPYLVISSINEEIILQKYRS